MLSSDLCRELHLATFMTEKLLQGSMQGLLSFVAAPSAPVLQQRWAQCSPAPAEIHIFFSMGVQVGGGG